jgi:putative membrane protein
MHGMLDLLLACLHHLLIFGLFGLLLSEFLLLKPGLDAAALVRVSRIDLLYGAAAALIVVVGFCRAIFAAKGWHYYSHNTWFWAKLATFAVIALISIPPTLALMRWRRSGTLPDESAIRAVRRLFHYELALFLLLPLFAAAMARGFGEF